MCMNGDNCPVAEHREAWLMARATGKSFSECLAEIRRVQDQLTRGIAELERSRKQRAARRPRKALEGRLMLDAEDTAREDAKALYAEQATLEREIAQLQRQLGADPECGELQERYKELTERYWKFLRNLSRIYYQEMGLGVGEAQ